jgi:site-specific recombinase XerD
MKSTKTHKKLKTYIREFLEYLEVERGRSQKTIRNYDFYLQRFSGWAKNPLPSAINGEMVRSYRLWLNRHVEGREEDTIKKSTQNYHLIALRSFLKYLAKRDVQSLAAEKIELAKQSVRVVEFLEPEELERLLVQPLRVSDGLVGLRDKAILELLFSTGMRVSELTSLEIESVNLEQEEFTVRGKGDKPRVVFLTGTAKEAIKEYLGKRRDLSVHLFVSHDRAKKGRTEHGSLTPRSIQRLVERYSKTAGITKRITPHTLRHTFATDLLRSGADIRSVQSLLGHESITTTQIYMHVTNQGLKEVHQKFHGKTMEKKQEEEK